MNVASRLQAGVRATRTRALVHTVALGAPLLLGLACVAARLGGLAAALGLVGVGSAGLAGIAVRRARRHDAAALARALDATRPDMDDSAALLFADPQGLAPLQRLQRDRLSARIARDPTMPPAAPWPRRGLALAWLLGLAIAVLALAWPSASRTDRATTAEAGRPGAAAGPVTLQMQQLRIEPPAYTGLPVQQLDTLDAQAPEGAQLVWTLRFAPQPDAVELERLDGSRLAFARDGDVWTARQRLEASMLYRIAVDGDADGAAARAQPYRIDMLPDRPPQVRVLDPEGTLTTMTPGQRGWRLVFEAEDDYGIAADAQLRLTVTRGTGENVTFEDSTRTLRGQGTGRVRRFETALDPRALGLQEGSDLVAKLRVTDTRVPQPQVATSPSLILRWPVPVPPDADGLEGLARDVLPAYFRSQRQIIIDAEALIAQRTSLAQDVFASRSDTIGVDQRLLRLRYGQFLGEESEGAPRRPLPTADAEPEPAPPPRRPLPIDDFGQQDTPASAAPATGDAHDHDHDDHDDHGNADGHAHDDAHDHDHDHGGAPRDAMTFGRAEDVLETFGHTHDLPEAATLLDPQTRELLRSALREMWQSELHLRQAEPQRALAPANRALELIKQVQQADRIYLARIGTRLPPVDMGRRLGGDRDGIAPRAGAGPDAAGDDDAATQAWRALAWDEAPDLAALVAWANAHPRQVDDPLALLAAVDALQRDPGCGDCRQQLRGQVWQALQRPLPAPARRRPLDAMGARYLDALGEDAP